ncbi:LysR family transcriptional regulator [Streptomyces acidiscabies]|uniref:LysR family transcriptional regulator n=1 Tax=Streptomyces acidiscabies TaxID=42234 RepID=A0AAP6BC19_9ACTN|nr:LysR family transcriptional regulator [Streptomyces acidiscabies]MBP5935766.1 LysR family transcriptional regulator [Streptomyces sp. LBUM 1476]MBZ3916335.1 LysR family transcriptional regulator [Streptomyces acidiscabies]MDX2961992.1 LysR family transcriptional regulator [Streptomyces acidiscabies]MDX3018011.1 LysR family transcriptional regulator [Streptomyces acidiscabies]MDX3791216.1 LysR family transcriptional regulator [Streptomyces acidiscabies]
MGLDLNLLVPLEALLQERSVSRAARRLGLSQPTVSAALARLRRHFGDELLTRMGNAYELTPLGESLAEHAVQALGSADRVFQARSVFEPARARREFSLVVTDIQLATFGRTLAALVRDAAPEVRLRFQHATSHLVRNAQEHLRVVDGMLLPPGVLTNVPAIDLYEDRWACVVSVDTVTPTPPAPEELAARPWVVPYPFLATGFPAWRQLFAHGTEPRVELTIESFLTMPYLIAGTDRVGVAPERAARLFPADSGTAVVDWPSHTGTLVESLWWHPAHARDPAHIWFRRTAAEAGRLVAAGMARSA